jgi:ABC-type arginine transport system ATPase subunit
MSYILQYSMVFQQYILWPHTVPENWQITSYPFDASILNGNRKQNWRTLK